MAWLRHVRGLARGLGPGWSAGDGCGCIRSEPRRGKYARSQRSISIHLAQGFDRGHASRFRATAYPAFCDDRCRSARANCADPRVAQAARTARRSGLFRRGFRSLERGPGFEASLRLRVTAARARTHREFTGRDKCWPQIPIVPNRAQSPEALSPPSRRTDDGSWPDASSSVVRL